MITFYLPEKYTPDSTWEKVWREEIPFPSLCIEVNIAIQHWIYLTWYRLVQAGVECQLSTTLPTHGIAIIWNAVLDPSLKNRLSPDVFFVDIAIKQEISPDADVTLVQNRLLAQQLPNALFVPHWPQPFLQPRDPERGARFENISFFGLSMHCTKELLSEEWFQLLRHEVGLFFESPRPYHLWHDYSNIDAVIAIRDFLGRPHLHKPATKLYNAWLAGVPFIGGADAAYAAEGIPGENYLVARSPSDVLAHLNHLKEDLSFRNRVVQRGFEASRRFTKEATLLYWKKLVEETLPALAARKKRLQ